MNSLHSLDRKYVPSRQKMAELSLQYKKQGKKVVFTNGVFDILHRGHISYLNQAKALGDILIIGVNTDESVKSFKGDRRPLNTLEDRMAVLSGLGAVDHVIEFSERLPNEIIKIVQPSIHVKGGDYTIDQMPEAKVVQELGGKVVILPFVEKRSTTNLIEKIISVYSKDI